jgi:hypothetical protein
LSPEAIFDGVFKSLEPYKGTLYLKLGLDTQKFNFNNELNPYEGLFTKGDQYYLYELRFEKNGEWVEIKDSMFIEGFTSFRDTIYF